MNAETETILRVRNSIGAHLEESVEAGWRRLGFIEVGMSLAHPQWPAKLILATLVGDVNIERVTFVEALSVRPGRTLGARDLWVPARITGGPRTSRQALPRDGVALTASRRELTAADGSPGLSLRGGHSAPSVSPTSSRTWSNHVHSRLRPSTS